MPVTAGGYNVLFGGTGNDRFYLGTAVDYIHLDYIESNGWERVYNFRDGQDFLMIHNSYKDNVYLFDVDSRVELQIYSPNGSYWIDFYDMSSARLADQIIYI